MLARVILVVSVGGVLSFLSPPGFRAFRQYPARVPTCIACRFLFSCGAVGTALSGWLRADGPVRGATGLSTVAITETSKLCAEAFFRRFLPCWWVRP